MGSRLLPIFAILLIAVVVSHAALPSEVYWDKVLPNTPMPKAVRELLRPGHKGKPVVVIAEDYFINYENYAASEDQLHADPNVPFFLEKDLKSGTKMNVHFTRTTNGARFLPRKVAEAIPLPSNKFPEVLKQFSVEPQSMEAEAMKQTVKECEKPASQEEEEKSCATSLESMKYIIAPGVKKMGGENSVVCHKQTYAYAVFYCHKTKSTEAYKVPLVGADGTKATAVAVCHTDTSKWNPKHLAFQVLKVKPGTVPICHFLPEDHIVWTSN
ncbi:hypothetical protein IFM89_024698 [Coptis chinensis]|uniref:BURP domain-containing protein n=1 Tax=Coptis chinensis TaxID=261450 RepID=A0A835IES9_9MAGN|nr:hypothetical protein IFM89_024698 [Coptis chinensis]